MAGLLADVMQGGGSGVITPYNQWAALGILLLIAAIFAVFNIILSSSLGPRRKGKVKDDVYESGVDPVGNTKQRFNVRFYLVAMIFLVFDVEILFLIPWVTIFSHVKSWSGAGGGGGGGGVPSVALLFGSLVTFMLILILAYVYAWGKGVFKWD